MGMVKVGLETLQQLDGGGIVAEFNEELKRCINDCLYRPHDTKPRKAVLQISVVPIPPTGAGVVEHANISAQIKSSIPVVTSREFEARVYGNGTLGINPASPDDVEQGTLDDLRDKP